MVWTFIVSFPGLGDLCTSPHRTPSSMPQNHFKVHVHRTATIYVALSSFPCHSMQLHVLYSSRLSVWHFGWEPEVLSGGRDNSKWDF
jgi:hypothetical protein